MYLRASRNARRRNHRQLGKSKADIRMFRRLAHERLEERVVLSISPGAGTYEVFDGLTYARPGVYLTDESIQPGVDLSALTLNIDAADTTNTKQLWTNGGLDLNLTGAGVTVGVWDGGRIRATHDEFNNGDRVTVIDTGASLLDHSTHVAGTIGARGASASARGMAGEVQIRGRDIENDLAELLSDASVIDLSNHSYGYLRGWTHVVPVEIQINPNTTVTVFPDTWVADRVDFDVEDPLFGKYTKDANVIDAADEIDTDIVRPHDLDTLLFDNPKLLSIWAAGNDRIDAYQGLFTFENTPFYYAYDSISERFGFFDAVIHPPPGDDGSAGSGFDTLPPTQVAKNSLVVGAIKDIVDVDGPYDAANPPTVTMTSYSSWGPTDDGRIKPDVVANGDALYSSEAASDTDYGTRSGTSMAAPSVTGTAALLLEHYRNLHVVRNLTAGDHDIRVEYYEDVDDAGLTLSWARPGMAKTPVPASVLWRDDPQVAGLDAEYFDFSTTLSDIPDFTGLTPDVTNVATQLNFAPTAGHWAGLTSAYDDTFAARYTGTINIATTDDYTFSLLADNEARLWIDDVLVIDDPRSATLKGTIIHTALDADNVGPDYSTGWGVVDAADAAQFLTDSMPGTGHTTDLFERTYDGTEWQFRVRTDGSDPLKVTIVWTDPAPTTLPGAGLDDATSVLVNDLDVWITDAANTTLYRPWTLDPANPATRREEYQCAA